MTNCRLLRMKLSRVSSWFIESDLSSRTGTHILCTCKHTQNATTQKKNLSMYYKTDMLIDVVGAALTQTMRRPGAHAVLHSCSPSSAAMGGSPLGPERKTVWMLSCLCLGD